MTILAVDSSAGELACMNERLCKAFPDDRVLTERDPLAAGKYSFSSPVDVLFAAMQMQRMSGWKLAAFVRQTNPGALIFLTVQPGQSDPHCLWPDTVDGLLTWPITPEALVSAVEDARRRKTGGGQAIRGA